MPLDIVRFIADTVHMDAEQTGAYLLGFATQWNVGPLPDDLEQCARIMRLHGRGAQQTVRNLLRRYFHRLPDGRWINLSSQARRMDAEKQAKRYSERAIKANKARWAGHTPKFPRRPSPSTPDEAKESQMSILYASNKDAKGMLVVIPEDLELELQNPSSSLRSEGRKRGRALNREISAGKPVAQRPGTAGAKAKARRTPLKTPPEASEKPRTTIPPTRGEKAPPTGKPSRNSPGKIKRPDPKKPSRSPDPRFAPFRKEVFRFWGANHPDGPNHPWGVEDGRSLNRLLKANPQLSLQRFQLLLKNRATSSSELVNISLAPFRWLHTLPEFSKGPWKRRPK